MTRAIPYEILEVENSDALIVRSADTPDNHLQIPDLRDLLQLRARLNQYIDTLAPDGTIVPPEEQEQGSAAEDALDIDNYITVAEAMQIISDAGYKMSRTTLSSAVYRGSIPGTFQRGHWWYIPRDNFELWLKAWASRR